MRILVTGGAGFIGSAIVDQLVERGHHVVAVDALLPLAHSEPPDYLNPDAHHLTGDVRDPSIVGRAVAGVDAVCHQAAMVGLGLDFADVSAYVGHNDLGTATLLEALHAARFSGRIVLASSMVVYGEGRYRCGQHGLVRPASRSAADLDAGDFDVRCPSCDTTLHPEAVPEEAPLEPANVYAATKLHQEHLVQAYGREHRVDTVALRYHNVYGPRMPRDTPYAGVAAIFRSAAEAGRAPTVFEDGGQLRDFVHVADVAQANVLALEAPPGLSGAFNVASGTPRTVLDMARALVDAVATGPDGTPPPPPEVVGGHRPGDVRHVFASPERAARHLGFRAAVPFERGVQAFAHAPLRERAAPTERGAAECV